MVILRRQRVSFVCSDFVTTPFATINSGIEQPSAGVKDGVESLVLVLLEVLRVFIERHFNSMVAGGDVNDLVSHQI